MPSKTPPLARTKIVSAGYGPSARCPASGSQRDARRDDVDFLAAVAAVVAVVRIEPANADPWCRIAGARKRTVQHADGVGHTFGAEQSGNVLQRNVRRDTRSPKSFEHVEFAARAAMLQHFGEPAQLVLLRHSAGAQCRLVERREAYGVDLAALREFQREPQRIEHERAVGGGGLRRRERRRFPSVPFQAHDGCVGCRSGAGRKRRQIQCQASDSRTGVEARALRDDTNARIGQRCAIGEQLGHQLGADAGGITRDQRDGGAHTTPTPTAVAAALQFACRGGPTALIPA